MGAHPAPQWQRDSWTHSMDGDGEAQAMSHPNGRAGMSTSASRRLPGPGSEAPDPQPDPWRGSESPRLPEGGGGWPCSSSLALASSVNARRPALHDPLYHQHMRHSTHPPVGSAQGPSPGRAPGQPSRTHLPRLGTWTKAAHVPGPPPPAGWHPASRAHAQFQSFIKATLCPKGRD